MKPSGQDSKDEKLDRKVKLLLTYIGIIGCLLLACGMGIVFGWGWSLVVMGLALLLIFVLGVLAHIIEDWNEEIKGK